MNNHKTFKLLWTSFTATISLCSVRAVALPQTTNSSDRYHQPTNSQIRLAPTESGFARSRIFHDSHGPIGQATGQQQAPFVLPSEGGPRHTQGAGTRGTWPASIQYLAPANSNARRSRGSGSLSCTGAPSGSLITLLIPSSDRVGQTISSHPTLSLYVSKPVPLPMRFSLIQRDDPSSRYETEIMPFQSGLIQIPIPDAQPGLEIGKLYRWSIAPVCPSGSASPNPFLYSWIERVPVSPEVEQVLAATSSRSATAPAAATTADALLDQAIAYAEAGLWYDALNALLEAKTSHSTDLVAQSEFLGLLAQAGLDQVAAQEEQSVSRP